ncbi:MAG: carboxypeptidase M32 [Candidatus Flexifilum sp.]
MSAPDLEHRLTELKTLLAEVYDLRHAQAVLNWDMNCFMPPGGASARARSLATLARLDHEKFTSSAIGRALDALQAYADGLPPDHDDAALVRVTRREYERALKVPADFVGRFNEHCSLLFDAWTKARPANDFASVRDGVKRTLDYSRQLAEFYAPYDHIADPLIDMADYGMKAADIRALFAALRDELVPLVRAITAQPPADDACLHQTFPEAQQIAFGQEVARAFGYDSARGRQDMAPHPFSITFAIGDVRITTRVKPDDVTEALFSTLHETGHALYEQGCNPAYDGTPLLGGTSAGVHESQSRLWENLVGRSRPFWEHYYPRLQAYFPDQLGAVPLETFYRAVNRVAPSLIRTDADEVTYNLHVMIRFDLELELLEGSLSVDDLPEAWRARYASDLGVTPPDDRDGVLQDVHWFGGAIGGMFQGYTLGNLLAAASFDAAVAAHPTIPQEIARGEFATLHTWLKENIYRHGKKYTAPELIARITGGALTPGPLIAYLRRKYGELYAL